MRKKMIAGILACSLFAMVPLQSSVFTPHSDVRRLLRASGAFGLALLAADHFLGSANRLKQLSIYVTNNYNCDKWAEVKTATVNFSIGVLLAAAAAYLYKTKRLPTE